ncbi:hypothetical protein AB6E04_06705 [Vibrio amylolyticus]
MNIKKVSQIADFSLAGMGLTIFEKTLMRTPPFWVTCIKDD